MAGQLAVLHLVFDEVGIGNDVSSKDRRIELQKVVCLAQQGGLSLGYGFNWYVRGPYSPGLTSDYYQLSADIGPVSEEAANLNLNETAKAVLARVRALLSPPTNVALSRTLWLELLASIAFLRKKYRYSEEQARQKILRDKPGLAPYFDAASSALQAQAIID